MTCKPTERPDPVAIPGFVLAREGARMLDELLPDKAQRQTASKRLLKRSIELVCSGGPEHRAIGFFLKGLAEAAGGRRYA